ncbi:MAG: hypothetical protein ACKN9T_01990 [Candidatus Methylumidiphilus sp.]
MKSPYLLKTWASVFCLSLLEAPPGVGAEYSLNANATLQQDFNSNIMLLPSALNPESVWGTDLDVQTSFAAAAPRWQANAGARFDNWFYYPLSGLDMQNQYLNGSFAYLISERMRWELNGSYISDALLSSQTDPTLGIVLGRLRRDMANIAPSWSYQLTEYTKLGFSYAYNDSSYPVSSKNQGGTYPDSHSHTVSTSISHAINQKLSLNGELSATTYQTATDISFTTTRRLNQLISELITNYGSSDREINYIDINVGFKYALDDDIDISFSGGGQLSQTITTIDINTATAQQLFLGQIVISNPYGVAPPELQRTRTDPQFGPLFNIGLTKKFDTSMVGLVYGHQISPSLNGQLFTSDRVAINASHRFSPEINSGLQLSYSSSSFPFQGGPSVDQQSFQLGMNVSYSMMKNLVINAAYSYQLRELGGGNYEGTPYAGTQDNHNVSVSLRYDLEQLHY